ncbi:hypothetical protein STEG23_038031 [Scotinomys teguina]
MGGRRSGQSEVVSSEERCEPAINRRVTVDETYSDLEIIEKLTLKIVFVMKLSGTEFNYAKILYVIKQEECVDERYLVL